MFYRNNIQCRSTEVQPLMEIHLNRMEQLVIARCDKVRLS